MDTNEEFQFPDEVENKDTSNEVEIEIEVEDDTPEQDRGRKPSDPEFVKNLEEDELEKYSEDAAKKLREYKKVWNDERRAREAAEREQQAAVDFAKKVLDENKKFKAMITNGEKTYVETLQNSASLELDVAKRQYKEAYESGDTDAIVEAQSNLQIANMKAMQAKNFKATPLQDDESEFKLQQEQLQPVSKPDQRAMRWQENNSWFGQDEEMTASALGLHEKLKRSGVAVGSDAYYAKLDETMRRRFPEQFDTEVEERVETREPTKKPATVVAPAVRSTSSKKTILSKSQVALAKKLGLTPEQYALELKKLEA